jgi:hypothetical protein
VRDLPAILGNAAEEFRASIEREVRTVLEAAQSRAGEIERQAEFNASQREQLSEHRAQQIVDTVYGRASRVLDSIDLVESALSGMLDALRAELQSLAPHGQSEALAQPANEPGLSLEEETAARKGREELAQFLSPAEEPPLERESVEPPSAEEPAAAEEPVAEVTFPEQAAPEAPLPEAPAAVQTKPAQPEAAETERAEASPDQSDGAEQPTDWQEDEGWPGPVPITPEAHMDASTADGMSEFDQMVRRQLMKMRSNGKTRAEAEHFLERFHFAGDYLGLLDEVYGANGAADPPRRRRLLSRLRRRD